LIPLIESIGIFKLSAIFTINLLNMTNYIKPWRGLTLVIFILTIFIFLFNLILMFLLITIYDKYQILTNTIRDFPIN
jgi:hypothetical protein